jgi:hypothetical protein
MKKFLATCALLGSALLLPLVSSAAVDMFLQIKDSKGEARVVHCAGGACLINGLAVGSYSVLVCDASGKVIPSSLTLDHTIVSPRDLASGQSSGKRMHMPITITAEVGRSAAAQNMIAIDEPGVQVAIGINAAATDAAVAKITKTRSNIQNN